MALTYLRGGWTTCSNERHGGTSAKPPCLSTLPQRPVGGGSIREIHQTQRERQVCLLRRGAPSATPGRDRQKAASRNRHQPAAGIAAQGTDFHRGSPRPGERQLNIAGLDRENLIYAISMTSRHTTPPLFPLLWRCRYGGWMPTGVARELSHFAMRRSASRDTCP